MKIDKEEEEEQVRLNTITKTRGDLPVVYEEQEQELDSKLVLSVIKQKRDYVIPGVFNENY